MKDFYFWQKERLGVPYDWELACIYGQLHIVSTRTGDRVVQSTIESDNKRRPVVLKRNASKYQAPSPEPPDPNSGT